MKNLNVAIKEVLIAALNKGNHELPIGLLVHELSDPFGEYGFKQSSVEKRLDDLVKSGYLSKKGTTISLR